MPVERPSVCTLLLPEKATATFRKRRKVSEEPFDRSDWVSMGVSLQFCRCSMLWKMLFWGISTLPPKHLFLCTKYTFRILPQNSSLYSSATVQEPVPIYLSVINRHHRVALCLLFVAKEDLLRVPARLHDCRCIRSTSHLSHHQLTSTCKKLVALTRVHARLPHLHS